MLPAVQKGACPDLCFRVASGCQVEDQGDWRHLGVSRGCSEETWLPEAGIGGKTCSGVGITVICSQPD